MKTITQILFASTLLIFIVSCEKTPAPNDLQPLSPNENLNQELIFQSGYENCIGSPTDAHTDITGADLSFSENNDWTNDLEGHSNIDNFWIYYEGGASSQRYAKIIQEPGNPSNSILHYWLNQAYIPYGNSGSLKGRIQATIQGTALREIYFKQRLQLHTDLDTLQKVPETFGWFTIQEFWNDGPEEIHPFRISVNIVKPNATVNGLYFRVSGQTKIANQDAWQDVWTTTNNTFMIPLGAWFTIETYFKEGDLNTGRFQVIVTDSSGNKFDIANITNYTYHPDDDNPDGLTKFNPMKLYCPDRLISPMNSIGKTIQLYYDDFEFWINNGVVGIGEAILPQTFSLSQNYPNPFNPTTTISYQLPTTNRVTLKVHDLLGKEVASLVNETKEAGAYSVKFDGSRLSSGIYFYTLRASQTEGQRLDLSSGQAGNFTATKKLMLMK